MSKRTGRRYNHVPARLPALAARSAGLAPSRDGQPSSCLLLSAGCRIPRTHNIPVPVRRHEIVASQTPDSAHAPMQLCRFVGKDEGHYDELSSPGPQGGDSAVGSPIALCQCASKSFALYLEHPENKASRSVASLPFLKTIWTSSPESRLRRWNNAPPNRVRKQGHLHAARRCGPDSTRRDDTRLLIVRRVGDRRAASAPPQGNQTRCERACWCSVRGAWPATWEPPWAPCPEARGGPEALLRQYSP